MEWQGNSRETVTGAARPATIDITDRALAGQAPAPRARWRAAVLVLGVLAAVGGAVAAHAFVRAQSWQSRALQLEAALVEADTRLAAAEADRADMEVAHARAQSVLATRTRQLEDIEAALATTENRLADSEHDVAALEDRLRELANEKAQVEDEREIARAESGLPAGAASLGADVGAALDACIDGLTGWVGGAPAGADAPSRWDAWAAQGDAVAGSCATARDGYAQLSAALGW